jgi:UDP-N-acetyl-D-mannosaminuronic acid dehydrogenase
MYKNISIVGGCGRVGLPLGMALAEADFSVTLIDSSSEKASLINRGEMPFLEDDHAPALLKQLISQNKLKATTEKSSAFGSDAIIFVTGTPVDEHLNPRISDLTRVFQEYLPYIKEDVLIILRSTVYPGVADVVHHLLSSRLKKFKLSFCPERIAQGKALKELKELPQIISGKSDEAVAGAEFIFSKIAKKVIVLSTLEAEFAKLITNAWRYVEFAIANQFYIMAEEKGLDFFRIYDAITADYPRAKHFASPGLAAGPCLFKDTMQLSAFNNGHFF